MNERVLKLRKSLNLTQEEFGKKIGIKKAAVSKIEKGENKLTETLQKIICNEFKVNSTWLINGSGEMFISLSEDEMLAEFMGEVCGSDNNFKKNLFLCLAKLNDAQWELLEEIIKDFKEK